MTAAPPRNFKRIALLMSGEGLQSGLNFALNLAFMHAMSAYDYGVFAIVMVVGGIGLNYIRSLTGIPASAFIGRTGVVRTKAFFEQAFAWYALALTGIIALTGYVILMVIEPRVALPASLFVALWCLRAQARTVYFASNRQREATYGDIAFVASGLLLAILAVWYRTNLLHNAMLLLMAANTIGLIVMRISAGQALITSPRKAFLPVYARLAPQLGWSLTGVTILSIQAQGIAFLIVALAGPAAFAPLAAMLVFFAPMRIVATALVNHMQPEVSRFLARETITGLRRQLFTWTAILAAFSLVYAVIMAIVLPFVVTRTLPDNALVLIAICAWGIGTMPLLYISPRLLLEVLMRFKDVAIITLIATVVGFGLTAFLLMQAPIHWALLGSFASEVTVTMVSWITALKILRQRQGSKTDQTNTKA